MRNNPMIGVSIGTEEMDEDKLAENALAVIKAVESKLPEKSYIKKIYVKTTMGPSIRVM
jgi:large subunit ribosomal protein L1